MFFDSPKVIKAVGRATARVLSKFGAYVRTAAMSSIRRRKGISTPGQPPSSHEGSLKHRILFGLEMEKRNVVIGPQKLNVVYFNRHRQPVTGTVPEVLEYGGEIFVLEVFSRGEWARADLRSRRDLAGKKIRYRRVRIKPRPFMHPAFNREKRKLPALWADSVK
jgi:hypothetical protein